MRIREVIETINQMKADGVIDRYAVGATFYLEPVSTLDVDIFMELHASQGLLVVDPTPIFHYLKERGCTMEGQYVVVADSLSSSFRLAVLSQRKRLTKQSKGLSKKRRHGYSRRSTSRLSRFKLEGLKTSFESCNSSKQASWIWSVFDPLLNAINSARNGVTLSGSF